MNKENIDLINKVINYGRKLILNKRDEGWYIMVFLLIVVNFVDGC